MKKRSPLTAFAVGATLLAAACGSSGTKTATNTTSPSANGGASTTAAATKTLLNGAIECKNQYAGKQVKIFSPVRDSDTDKPVAQLLAAYAPFEECTGAKVVWEGTDQFETEVNVRLQGGSPPDVIDFPQPGLMADLSRKGLLKELSAANAKSVNADFITGWSGYATVDGKVFGMPARANVKSLVWYSPAFFKAKRTVGNKSIDFTFSQQQSQLLDSGPAVAEHEPLFATVQE